MPKLKDFAKAIELGNGESIVVTVHPDGEFSSKPGGMGGTTYHIPVMLPDGRGGVLRGGERLMDALRDALGNATGPVKLKVTAHREARTLAREWAIIPAQGPHGPLLFFIVI